MMFFGIASVILIIFWAWTELKGKGNKSMLWIYITAYCLNLICLFSNNRNTFYPKLYVSFAFVLITVLTLTFKSFIKKAGTLDISYKVCMISTAFLILTLVFVYVILPYAVSITELR